MRSEFLNSIKVKLEEMKESLNKDLNKQESIDYHGDDTDYIQAKILLVVDNVLLARKQEQIKKINLALEKIESQKYGICVDCDCFIAEKRLEYNPWFETCVDCASDREKEMLNQRK